LLLLFLLLFLLLLLLLFLLLFLLLLLKIEPFQLSELLCSASSNNVCNVLLFKWRTLRSSAQHRIH